MTNIKKTNNNSIAKAKKPIDWKDAEMVEDLFTGEMRPYPIELIKVLAQEALDYCINDPKCLKISQFIRHKRLQHSTYYFWVSKYDWFKKNHIECMRALGDKREIGAINRQYDKEMISKVMHLYDDEWDRTNRYWADLKKDEESNKGPMSVVMYQVPSTGQVKPKTVKKEE